MKKQNKSQNKKANTVSIPLIRNKVERDTLNIIIHEWVCKKFQNIYFFVEKSNEESQLNSKNNSSRSTLCKQLQKQMQLKHSIQNIILRLSMQYYQTLINYIIEKKLHWIFKNQTLNQQHVLSFHKEIEINLSLKLKQMYKSFEIQQKCKKSANSSDFSDQQKENCKSGAPNTNICSFQLNLLKKTNPDFDFQLLIMFSVSLVAGFFQHFFTQVSIDRVFKSEIYVIITHVFVDIQISPNVFDIMKRKYCILKGERIFKSLNSSCVQQLTLSQFKKPDLKFDHNQNSKKNITKEIKSILSSNKQLKNSSAGQNKTNEESSSKSGSNIRSLNGLNSTIGFSTSKSIKRLDKRDILIRPAASIDNNLLQERLFNSQNKHNNFANTSYNCSRFQSFLQNTKKMNVSPILQDLMGQDYFPTEQQLQFYSAIKKNLHIDVLPPIIKKKLNINHYQKLNEAQKLKEIKKEVKKLDSQSKKNCLKSNELSLAMNTFISFSNQVSNKKRNKKNVQIVKNYLQKDSSQVPCNQVLKNTSRSNNCDDLQSQAFQLRKLPLRPAYLKLKPQKSSNLYKFDGLIQQEIPQETWHQRQNTCLTLQNKFQFSYSKLQDIERKTQKTVNRQKNKSKELKFQQKKKKSTTQWEDFIQELKLSHNKQQIMTLGNVQSKNDKKRSLMRQAYTKFRQYDMNSHADTQNTQKTILNLINKQKQSMKSIGKSKKKINLKEQQRKDEELNLEFEDQTQNESSQNSQKNRNSRSSFLHYLSSKLQTFEVENKMVTNLELGNENNQQSESNDIQKYSSLQGQVNVHNDVSTSYTSQYKSYDLKKKLHNFQQNCKKREQKSNYSIFHLKQSKNLFRLNNQRYYDQNN